MVGHFSQQQLRALLSAHFDDFLVQPVHKGISSYTYKVATPKAIYYLTIPDENTQSLAARYHVLKQLVSKGCLVPKPIAYEDFTEVLDGYSYLLCTEVAGVDLEAADPVDVKSVLYTAGKHLAIAHSIKIKSGFGYINQLDKGGNPIADYSSYYQFITGVARYTDSFENKLKVLTNSKVINVQQSDKIMGYIVENMYLLDYKNGVLMHDDFVFDHIYSHNGNFTGIIDWEAMASGSIYNDFAIFSTYHGDEMLAHLMQGYKTVVDKNELELFEQRLLIEQLIYTIGKTAKGYVKQKSPNKGYKKVKNVLMKLVGEYF